MRRLLLAAALLGLTGCGGSPADNAADQLENAADQSDPAAAATLRNAAEDIRADDATNVSAEAQEALQAAGNAQSIQPSPNVQAVPHRPTDAVPPPTRPTPPQ